MAGIDTLQLYIVIGSGNIDGAVIQCPAKTFESIVVSVKQISWR